MVVFAIRTATHDVSFISSSNGEECFLVQVSRDTGEVSVRKPSTPSFIIEIATDMVARGEATHVKSALHKY